MTKLFIAGMVLAVGMLGAATAQADPYRKATNAYFNAQQRGLAQQQKAVQRHEKAMWQNARQFAPPQQRRFIDQQYQANRKAIAQDFSATRRAVSQAQSQTNRALKQDFRHSVQYYNFDRRFAAPVYGSPYYW
jgi:Tfp pilus assembly protein PilV